MKYVNCNYCGADQTEPVNHGPDLLLNRPEQYYLVRCCQCGLIYQNPQPTLEELSQHYPEDYKPYRHNIQDEKQVTRRLDAQYGLTRRSQQLISHHPEPGKLLDIGCATGLFINEMQLRGWHVQGVELSAYAAEYARQTFALDVVTGTVETAAFPSHTFDVITMWDVLEHVIDPKGTLAEIKRILKPGGMLALSLPNPSCIEARLFGSTWIGWDRPRHLHIFTPSVLKKYLNDAGFQNLTFESLGGRLGLTLLSLQLLLTQKGVNPSKIQTWTNIIYNWPFRVATWPIYRIGEKLNQTTVMNVFARMSR
jgi:2-polyprenyl-3-methyl-5-hydroxy-6-metoxy-1,4-benzoquinol methylase